MQSCRRLVFCEGAQSCPPLMFSSKPTAKEEGPRGEKFLVFFGVKIPPFLLSPSGGSPHTVFSVLGRSKGTIEELRGWWCGWLGLGKSFMPPDIFSSPISVSWAAEWGTRGPCVTHTVGASLRASRLPRAPLTQKERFPGLQNWKHRPRDEEGKDGAISKSLLLLVGGCDEPCLALFISGLSCHPSGSPSPIITLHPLRPHS